MALTKVITMDKIEIVGQYKLIQCRNVTTVSEDGVEISSSFVRYSLSPSICSADVDSDGELDGTFTHTDWDISGEPAEVQAVCAAVWTDAVKAAWKTYEEENCPL